MSNKFKNILFRADSSSLIGTGHIMRDLVLAKQYPNAKIIFATQNLSGNINHKITEAGYEIKILKSNDIKELNKLIKKLNINLLVIDHYGIDCEFEKQLKIKNPTLKILSFDDMYEKHYCDMLLNHNISADEKKYKNLVPKKCELKCGSDYTLLRDEFYKEKKKLKNKKQAIPQNKKYKVLLAMGGVDHTNSNIKILQALQEFDNIQTTVVTTNANKNLDKLKKYVKNKKNISLHVNSNTMAKLMRKSDFAIVTPSVTVNEAYFMELPFIAIKTAENQDDMYQFLKENNFLVLKKLTMKKLNDNIQKIMGLLQ